MAGSIEVRGKNGRRLVVNPSGSINVADGGGSLTGDGTVTVVQPTYANLNATVKPYAPAAADILSGGVNVVNSAASTTIITVPAGRTWFGSVNFAAQYSGGASSLINDVTILTAGTGVTPAAGTIMARMHTTQTATTRCPSSSALATSTS